MVNKLQNENVTLKRDKNKPQNKSDLESRLKNIKVLNTRGSVYVPTTQKLIIKPIDNDSKNPNLIKDFEPNEDKIKEIENNIFHKISESVDKIFSFGSVESRVTFNIPGLNDAQESLNSQNKNTKNRENDIKSNKYKEIVEEIDEDEIDSYRQNL